MAEGGIVTPRHPDTDRPLREALRDLVILAGTTENPQDALDAADRLADTLGLRLPAEPGAPDPATAERRRLAGALANWALSPGESFRTLLPFLDMPYTEAYRDGWMTFTNAINDRMTRAEAASQPVPTPEPPAEPDPCDGCGASRLSMRHYIGCPMASTHRWDPVVGTWVASYPRRDILDRLMELWQEPWSEPAFGEAQMLLARLRLSQPVPTPEPPADPHDHEFGCVICGELVHPASVPEAAPGLRRWAESLLTHAERDGLVWVTKAEVRAALATPPPALDAPRHPDDTPCEHLIPARECRIVGCRGASTDTPE
jgi:hypothetical protein